MRTCLTIFLMFIAINSYSQVQVKIKRPPLNQLGVKDIWNLTVRNTSPGSIQLYLRGTAEEIREGQLVEGKTGMFTLKANESRSFTGTNVPGGGTYNWMNNKFKEALLRSGNAPSGNYTICIYAESESGAPLGQDCFTQIISLSSPPSLVSPGDGEVISSDQMPIFNWLPPTPAPQGASYTLKIVEIQGNQSPEEAMLKNSAFFEQKNIRSINFQYPVSSRKFRNDKKYVWRVEVTDNIGSKGNENRSSLSVFSLSNNCTPDYESEFDSLKCDGNGKVNVVGHITIPVKNGITINTVAITGIRQNDHSGTNISADISLPKALLLANNNTFPFNFTLDSADCNKKMWIGFEISSTCSGTGATRTLMCFDTVSLPCCICNYCDQFKHFEDTVWTEKITLNQQSGAVDLETTINMPSTLEIKSFKAEIINFTHTTENGLEECILCNKNSQSFANIVSGTLQTNDWGTLNGFQPMLPNNFGSSLHTLKWFKDAPPTTHINGSVVKISLAIPKLSSLDCCNDILNFCIRYSFISSDCQSCSFVKCYQVKKNNQQNHN